MFILKVKGESSAHFLHHCLDMLVSIDGGEIVFFQSKRVERDAATDALFACTEEGLMSVTVPTFTSRCLKKCYFLKWGNH